MTQNLWDAAKAVLRRKFIANLISPQETRKTSNKQSNLTPKATRERRSYNRHCRNTKHPKRLLQATLCQ